MGELIGSDAFHIARAACNNYCGIRLGLKTRSRSDLSADRALGVFGRRIYSAQKLSSFANLDFAPRSWIVRGLSIMKRTEPDARETHRTMDVVTHIRALIKNGTLKPGDKLPPERELARSLKISRASLRAGIGYMATMGIMKVRHGVGTFVADGPPEFGKAYLGFMEALHGFQSWHMFETRLILEGNLAALAAERGREEHCTALAEEVAEMFAALESPEDYLIHDVLFHRIISQASGNPILAVLMESITSAIYDARRRTVEHSTDLRESAEMHREIYRAIRAKNPADARKLMEQHLRLAQVAQEMESQRDWKAAKKGPSSRGVRDRAAAPTPDKALTSLLG